MAFKDLLTTSPKGIHTMSIIARLFKHKPLQLPLIDRLDLVTEREFAPHAERPKGWGWRLAGRRYSF